MSPKFMVNNPRCTILIHGFEIKYLQRNNTLILGTAS